MHGATPRGVDWNGTGIASASASRNFCASSRTRRTRSILDLGCGFGDFLSFLAAAASAAISAVMTSAAAMIDKARELHGETDARWCVGAAPGGHVRLRDRERHLQRERRHAGRGVGRLHRSNAGCARAIQPSRLRLQCPRACRAIRRSGGRISITPIRRGCSAIACRDTAGRSRCCRTTACTSSRCWSGIHRSRRRHGRNRDGDPLSDLCRPGCRPRMAAPRAGRC